MNAGDAKGIEAGGAIVEKEDIGTGGLAVTGIDALVLAVMHPKAVEDDGHPRIAGCGTALDQGRRAAAVHGNAGEGPFLRATGRTVDAIPAVNEETLRGIAPGRKRPGFGAFRIVAAGGVETKNGGQARRASKYRVAGRQAVIGRGALAREILSAIQDGGPAFGEFRAVSEIVFGRDEQVVVVIGINGQGDTNLLHIAEA